MQSGAPYIGYGMSVEDWAQMHRIAKDHYQKQISIPAQLKKIVTDSLQVFLYQNGMQPLNFCGRFAVILQRIAAISPDIEVIRPVPAIFLQIFPYGLMYMIGRIDILLGTVNRKQGQYCYTGEQRNERFFAFECKEVKSE